jgi:uncharacterized Zn finger protein
MEGDIVMPCKHCGSREEKVQAYEFHGDKGPSAEKVVCTKCGKFKAWRLKQ